jgi:hypothetical protein
MLLLDWGEFAEIGDRIIVLYDLDPKRLDLLGS